MKYFFTKTISIILVFIILSTILPASFSVSAQDTLEKVVYNKTIIGDGWINDQVVLTDNNDKYAGTYSSTTPAKSNFLSKVEGMNTDLGVAATKWKVPKTAAGGVIWLNSDVDSGKRLITVPNTKVKAYFEMDFYTTLLTPLKIRLCGHAPNSTNKWPNMEYVFENYENNKWHSIAIPLEDFTVTSSNCSWKDFEAIDNIKMYLPDTIGSDFNIYIKNMRFTYEPTLNVTTQVNDNYVNLSWTLDYEAAFYRIYRNDKLIADNITNTSYTDEGMESGNTYIYRVEAYDNNQNKIAQITKSVDVGNIITNELISDIGAANTSIVSYNAYHTGVIYVTSSDLKASSVSWGVTKNEKGAAKFTLNDATVSTLNSSSAGELRIKLNSGAMNYPCAHITDGFLKFNFYAETSTKSNLPLQVSIGVKNVDGEYPFSRIAFPQNIKLNEWNEITLYLKDFSGTEKQQYLAIDNIRFNLPKNLTSCNFYISDMNFGYNPEISGNIYAEKKMINSEDFDALSEDSVIMYKGAKYASINGYKIEIENSLAPVIIGNIAYVPLDFILEALGAEKSNVSSGETLVSHEVIEHNQSLYAAAKDVSDITNTYLLEKGNVIIFSKESIDYDIDDTLLESIRNVLSWEIGNMNLTAEGFVVGLISHPLDSDIMYCRTDVGGCYRWDGEKQKWIQLMYTIPYDEKNLTGVMGFAVDPNNKDVIYIYCGKDYGESPCYLLKSTDRGKTWQNTGFDLPTYQGKIRTRYGGERVAIDPNNSDIIYVGTNEDGLWRSFDGAKSWTRVAEEITGVTNEGVSVVVFDNTTGTYGIGSSVIYVSAYGDGLYKSSDYGETFTKLDIPLTKIQRMRMYGSDLYIAASNHEGATGGFYRYTSTGVLEDLTPPFKSELNGVADFMIDYINPDFMIVAGETLQPEGYAWSEINVYERWRTKDGGVTWEYFESEDDVNAAVFLQDPKNPQRLLEANGRGLWTYENIYVDDIENNVQYGRFQTGIEELVCLKVMTLPSENAPMFLAGCYDRNYLYCENKSEPAVLQWYEYNKSKIYGWASDMDYCEKDPSFAMRVCRKEGENYILLSKNYGRAGQVATSWDKTDNVIACAIGADVQDNNIPTVIVAMPSENSSNLGSLYRSNDWGESWTKLSGVDVNAGSALYSKYRDYILISDYVDKDTFYYCDNNNFYTTEDGGDSWTLKYTFDNVSSPSIYTVPGKEGEVWLNANGKIYKTTDKGASWQQLNIANSCSYMSFGKGKDYFDNPALYIIGTVNGVDGVYISDDMGVSLRRMDNDGLNPFIAEFCQIAGDMNQYGRVFVSTGGYGIVCIEETLEKETNNILVVKNNEITRCDSIITCNVGDTLSIYADNQDYSISYEMVAAVYDENNALDRVYLLGENNISGNCFIESGDKKVKVMMWSNIGDMRPVVGFKEIYVN